MSESFSRDGGETWIEPVYGLRSSRRTCNDPHAGQRSWTAAERVLEVGGTGLCGDGHPVTALCVTLADRLAAAGIRPDDPGLEQWRQWNRGVFADAGRR